MIDIQMELSFGGNRGARAMSRRQRRLSRAHWWFDRMRRMVDRAVDWSPAPAPRAEQTWFANTYRQLSVGTLNQRAESPSQERQMCE